MKTAAREITVYSSDGQNRIGALQRGEKVLELSDTDAGTVIAYIVGLVKSEDKAALLTQEEWEKTGTAADRLCAFAAAQADNGSIYVLGAQGQTGGEITEAWIKMREHNDASNYNRAIALWKKRLAAGYKNLRAFDCSGLIIRHLLDEKLVSSDKTANGIYFDLCDPIGNTALAAGDLVFRKYLTQNRMYHVGVYMGDGTVVHSKGRDDGVVREATAKTNWNRFGRLKCFGGAAAKAGYYRLLKNTGKPYMSGADVTAVQAALAAKGYSPGAVDGVYGPNTEAAVKAFQSKNGLEVDGIVGPKTWAALVG
jgi:cell wall-associated NlpC family hydrolase